MEQTPNGIEGPDARRGEAGFTLVETLVAIVILVFGLMAVSNLMLVAATSNSVANQGTAAAAAASETLEALKQVPFSALVDGGSLTADTSAGGVDFFRRDQIKGVGPIHTRWVVTTVPTDAQVKFITVQSEGTGPMVRGRTRTVYTTFRSCTAVAQGC
jgi:prepilin-type N-terminal cleavage/methylation domain-containing protein